ncbi:STAS domain-containing protein [Nonomuraea dietziae]|uniref:Anti-sigma factor antagonist n=1 Tax=Nonomuraea dietziae TaxID=65515 RepID=A0A7W5V8F7_9ACTN|nr:STAS domain-containing protein [Nonomuraea dietziae]MBB3731234.1 stage II sporulation protein AA (anti-sigma F factor antagonist) [Nonomuraea dietziae]
MTAEQALSISLGLQGPCVIARLTGEFDFGSAAEVRDRVTKALDLSLPPMIIIDMQAVSVCDSSGLSVLVYLHKAVTASGGRLLVSGLNGRCKHLFAITALDRFFEIRPTAELAIAELSESGHSPPFVG